MKRLLEAEDKNQQLYDYYSDQVSDKVLNFVKQHRDELFSLPEKEFQYVFTITIKLFDEFKKYFPNIKNNSTQEKIVNDILLDGNNLRESGLISHDEDTIWDKIENYSDEYRTAAKSTSEQNKRMIEFVKDVIDDITPQILQDCGISIKSFTTVDEDTSKLIVTDDAKYIEAIKILFRGNMSSYMNNYPKLKQACEFFENATPQIQAKIIRYIDTLE